MNMPMQHSAMTDAHLAHPDDPGKQSEHVAMLELAPHKDATHVAVRNGSWFDPNTWKDNVVPQNNARVLIPDGVTVDYDGVSEAELFTLRVDGQLDFATDQTTKMVIDTFLVAPEGKITIGTEDNPVQSNVEARIVIADNGAINKRWDPQQLSRGLISHGEVEIHGQEKTIHLKLSQDAMAGDSQLELAQVPTNWKVGDRLVLTGTRFLPDQAGVRRGTQDEELTIKAINGNTITLEESLRYDHDSPKDDLKASVANYSRNVIIETENASKVPVGQRGHVMFMHSDSVDVRYAEFHELGRTDKSRPLDDFRLDGEGDRILDRQGNPIKTSPDRITNQRGRYAVHFHRTGVNGEDSDPAIAMGNAVWGSPGWGYVHHDSYVILDNNAAYDVLGAAFMSETGNEIGAWRNNIAIKSEGAPDTRPKEGIDNHDLGHDGTGFWFQGRLVENENNIAAGHRHTGIMYVLRGADQMDVLSENLPNPVIARYADTVSADIPPIHHFKNNEAFASRTGLQIFKTKPHQRHDVRSVIDGFKGWEVHTGAALSYTSKYTLNDFYLVGAESRTASGIDYRNNAEDLVVNGAKIEGFKRGINMRKQHFLADLDDFHYAFVDVELSNNETDYVNLDRSVDKVLRSEDLKPGSLSFQVDSREDFILGGNEEDPVISLRGTKTDSLGSIRYPSGTDFAEFTEEHLRDRIQDGYFVDANGTRFFRLEELFEDRVTGEILQQNYIVTLADNWNGNTLELDMADVPMRGTYSGNVRPGLSTPNLDRWVEQRLDTPTMPMPYPMPPTPNPTPITPSPIAPPPIAPPEMIDPPMAPPTGIATDGDDVLYGTAGNDFLQGQGGNDRLSGLAGDDRLYGQLGNDYLSGGDGEDRLEGAQGADILSGGQAFDRLLGGVGNDTLMGDEGSDILKGGKGQDIFVLQDLPGVDKIVDFKAVDRLGVSSSVDLDQLTLVQQGKNTLVQMGGQTLAQLNNVKATSVNDSAFVDIA